MVSIAENYFSNKKIFRANNTKIFAVCKFTYIFYESEYNTEVQSCYFYAETLC